MTIFAPKPTEDIVVQQSLDIALEAMERAQEQEDRSKMF